MKSPLDDRIVSAIHSVFEQIRPEETHKMPSLRYLDWFISKRSSLDLLALSMFPNAKEITESMSCLNAVRHLGMDRSDPSYTVIVVGDGRHPRTGALFAFNSPWTVHSIDPMLHHDGTHPQVKRLFVHRNTIEQFRMTVEKAIIVMPHSHAKVTVTLERIEARERHLIALPCCVPIDIETQAYKVYDDWGVFSPKRKMYVYRNI